MKGWILIACLGALVAGGAAQGLGIVVVPFWVFGSLLVLLSRTALSLPPPTGFTHHRTFTWLGLALGVFMILISVAEAAHAAELLPGPENGEPDQNWFNYYPAEEVREQNFNCMMSVAVSEVQGAHFWGVYQFWMFADNEIRLVQVASYEPSKEEGEKADIAWYVASRTGEVHECIPDYRGLEKTLTEEGALGGTIAENYPAALAALEQDLPK